MAEEKKKVPIAYAMRPVVDEQGNVTGYEKYNPVTTGNAVVAKDKEGNNKVLNKILREHEEEMQRGTLGLFIKNGKVCQRIAVTETA